MVWGSEANRQTAKPIQTNRAILAQLSHAYSFQAGASSIEIGTEKLICVNFVLRAVPGMQNCNKMELCGTFKELAHREHYHQITHRAYQYYHSLWGSITFLYFILAWSIFISSCMSKLLHKLGCSKLSAPTNSCLAKCCPQ